MKNPLSKIILKLIIFLYRFLVNNLKRIEVKPIGLPLQRDPDAPCEYYEPHRKGTYDFQYCETDGHYLCQKCGHRKIEPNERYD